MAPAATTHGVRHAPARRRAPGARRRSAARGSTSSPRPRLASPRPATTCSSCINENGVPSVASWVKIDPTAPDQPTLGPPPQPARGRLQRRRLSPTSRSVCRSRTSGSATDAGAVNVIYGSAGGLTRRRQPVFDQNDLGGGQVGGESVTGFGAALASADFDHDGFADLAVGAPGEDHRVGDDAGTSTSSTARPTACRRAASQVLSQGSGGIAGQPPRPAIGSGPRWPPAT